MLIVQFVDKLKGPQGFPEWLGDNLHWFTKNTKQKKMALIRFPEEGNKNEWLALGETLISEMIFPNDYIMTMIQDSFPTDILDSWVSFLNSDVVWEKKGAESCFSYIGSVLQGMTTAQNVMWTSVTTKSVSPFGKEIFSLIPPYIPIGCNILFASPENGEGKELVRQFLYEPSSEFIFKHMGSWISPLEEYGGYFVGILEGQIGWERILDSCWLEKQIQSKINTNETG
ncbi:MAG: hypothetical protein M1379_05735 [Firmicutes bacterium]|nr:hypothetical protein [Bacillota bacterium]